MTEQYPPPQPGYEPPYQPPAYEPPAYEPPAYEPPAYEPPPEYPPPAAPAAPPTSPRLSPLWQTAVVCFVGLTVSGALMVMSLFARDLNLLFGIFFLSACLVVVVNLIVDLLYAALDPRIEMG